MCCVHSKASISAVDVCRVNQKIGDIVQHRIKYAAVNGQKNHESVFKLNHMGRSLIDSRQFSQFVPALPEVFFWSYLVHEKTALKFKKQFQNVRQLHE